MGSGLGWFRFGVSGLKFRVLARVQGFGFRACVFKEASVDVKQASKRASSRDCYRTSVPTEMTSELSKRPNRGYD